MEGEADCQNQTLRATAPRQAQTLLRMAWAAARFPFPLFHVCPKKCKGSCAYNEGSEGF